MSVDSQLVIILKITPEGLQPPEIHTSSEAEEKAAVEILERIQPCLDVADAIIKKGDPGQRG